METIKNLAKVLAVKAIVLSIGLFYGAVTILSLLYRRYYKVGSHFWDVKDRSLPPLCLQETAYGRHAYLKLQGIKLHYVENGDRSKPLMLFVHGFPEFWFSWRHQLKYFAETHWVVAMDLRGYGDSDKPTKVSEYKFELLEKDIYDFVVALGREKCTLVGHDWGGGICWGVASTYPEIVEKLIILNCPHPSAFAKKLQSSLSQFFKSWYIFLFQLPYLPEMFFHNEDLNCFRRMFQNADKKCSVNDEDLEGFKYTFSKKGAWTPPINYYRNSFTAKGLLNPPKMDKIKAPTLIIWGENDLALEKDLPQLSGEFVDNLQIKYVEKANHFVQQDKPDEVNKLIEAFVTK